MTYAIAFTPSASPRDRDERREVCAALTDVADGPYSPVHRHAGRALAEQLDYPQAQLGQVPSLAVDSFVGVGHPLGLAALQPGEQVVGLGCGAGLDSFLAALQVGPAGRVHGIDESPAHVRKANAARVRDGSSWHLDFRVELAESLSLADASVDCVFGNGVLGFVADPARAFAEAARVLRPGGRIALSDVVTAVRLPWHVATHEAVRAAGLGGAMHRRDYQEALSAAGFSIKLVQINDYRFRSDAMRRLAGEYGARSISLVATRS